MKRYFGHRWFGLIFRVILIACITFQGFPARLLFAENSSGSQPAIIPGQVIVVLKDEIDLLESQFVSGPRVGSLEKKLGVTIKEGRRLIPQKAREFRKMNKRTRRSVTAVLETERNVERTLVIKVDEKTDIEKLVERLKKNPHVKDAYPDYEVRINGDPNDPLYPSQWGMKKIQMPEAWDISQGDESIVVAVIDSGVQWDHPDLAANIWTNLGEIPANGVDDDGNGYVDDVHGYDFHNVDGDPYDDHNHGSHVAGVIGAVGNNGVGVAGVNFRVKIMALKSIAASGSGSSSNTSQAILYAINNGADVINFSLSGAFQPNIQLAYDNGLICVASAGNNGAAAPNNPAAQPHVISVSATDENDARIAISNFNADIAAPGMNILSTVRGGSYGTMFGTSMAAPHVTGAVALILSVNPNLDQDDFENNMTQWVDDLGSAGYDPDYGHGRLNVQKGLNFWKGSGGGGDTTPPSVQIISPLDGSNVSGTVSVQATASDNVGVTRVEFSIDGMMVLSDTIAPYAYSWYDTILGNRTLLVKAFDAAGNNTDHTITVRRINNMPSAIDQSVVLNQDQSKSIVLTGSDPDGDSLTFSIVSASVQGTLAGSAPNVTYIPASNYSGQDSFTFSVNDGNQTSVAGTVTLTINAVDKLPDTTLPPPSLISERPQLKNTLRIGRETAVLACRSGPVDIFTVRGNSVRQLECDSIAGTVHWDGKNSSQDFVSSGMYMAIQQEEPPQKVLAIRE